MKGTYHNSYPKRAKNGNTVDVFVYTVTGTTDELDAFKDAQGANYRTTDDGKPLYFTLNYISDNVELVFTSNGNVVVDTSSLRKAANLAKQYGFLGEKLADRIVSDIMPGKSVASVGSGTPAVEEPKELDPFSI